MRSGAGTEACREGREELEALYRTEAPRLLRLITRRTGSREDALDLVQEAFLRVARRDASEPGRLERPAAYLVRIAGNLLRDRARTSARRSAALHEPANEESLCAADEERRLEARDGLARLESAMLRLKPRTREIFMAHRLDGLTYAEIAARTGLSVKGVEKQMSRAIAHLDRMMDRS